jgi:hypothetical protein
VTAEDPLDELDTWVAGAALDGPVVAGPLVEGRVVATEDEEEGSSVPSVVDAPQAPTRLAPRTAAMAKARSAKPRDA